MAERKGTWMQTYTGRQFWPIDPRPEDVSILDIARALSMMCRYNGHCSVFYSVAEHSVLVSQSVPKKDALWALLHDASEAYIADIVRPAKPFIEGYRDVENRIMSAIAKHFSLPSLIPETIKEADMRILRDEYLQVIPKSGFAWDIPEERLGVAIEGWEPAVAEKNFLDRYIEIQRW